MDQNQKKKKTQGVERLGRIREQIKKSGIE